MLDFNEEGDHSCMGLGQKVEYKAPADIALAAAPLLRIRNKYQYILARRWYPPLRLPRCIRSKRLSYSIGRTR